MHRWLLLGPALLLAGCAHGGGVIEPPATDLAHWFDCLRERGEAVVSVHRAGPGSGRPENSLAAMAATLGRLPGAIVEIDVRQSRDGTLFLFHDDRLDRKSTGQGPVQEKSWAELAPLRLRDSDGGVTDQPIPTLSAALDAVRKGGGLAQLDVKRGVDFKAVIAAVRQSGTSQQVIIITYREADAATVARLAPDLMISASVATIEAARGLMALGVKAERLLAWTGNRTPDPALYSALRLQGIESIFGTLGRSGERLDDVWLADGDAAEFAAIERDGVVVVATDRADVVAAALGSPSCRR